MKKETKKPKKSRKGEDHKGGLNERQWKFCFELVRTGRKQKAAILAGYSKKSAYSQACDLLKKPEIQDKIAKLRKQYAKKMDVSVENVLAEYAKLAFSDITDILDISDGIPVFKDIENIDPKHLSALQSVSVSNNGIKYKMHDKKGALDSLAKHLDMFSDDNKTEIIHRVGNIKDSDKKLVSDLFDKLIIRGKK